MFTELEYVLMICIAVLLWRNSRLRAEQADMQDHAARYSYFLLQIYQGKGTVVREDGKLTFKENT